MADIDFEKYCIKEIKEMILQGKITNDEVIRFYNNEWWDYEEKINKKYLNNGDNKQNKRR